MGVQPSDFEEHAERIEDDYDDEIDYRCAISRRYYYIFHLVREQNRNHTQANFSFGSGGNDHHEASEFIRRITDRNLADDFDDLRNDRNEADYDINDDIDDLDLATFKQNLEQFVLRAKREGVIM